VLPSSLERFSDRLRGEWLPIFCDDEKRRLSPEGFKLDSIGVTEFDASNFMKALDSGLVIDTGGGRYRCARSYAFEQIFWPGRKSVEPQPLTLWIEPVITIGTMARLGLEYGWPTDLLCMQSKDGAFDFAVFRTASNENEFIAGEVKKTSKELGKLTRDLFKFAQNGTIERPSGTGSTVNSFKKWLALLRCRAPFFWAVGPDNYTQLFAVQYNANQTATFTEIELDQLRAPEDIEPCTTSKPNESTGI